MSESERKKLPPAYAKIFTLNLGTAYLLKGNFVDAKQRLRECASMDPNPLLRGYALNNLAVACWWHKHPSFRDLEDNDEDGSASTTSSNSSSGNKEYSAQQIDADFDNAISMFKKSIMYIENVDELQDMQRRNHLRLLLDQEKIIPTEYQKFESSPTIITNMDSGIPMINI